ncbi:MAG: carboxypeptidase-like regulatory domain-containing protein [Planctomycetaceae bacterium]
MSFLKTTCTRFVAWSLTIALIANGPMLSAEQGVSNAPREQTSEHESVMQDVKLATGGILTARIVDPQGNPVVGEQVSVMFQGKEIASVVSDPDGVAAVSGLRPGLHAIVTPTGTIACRLWNADTAPPTATAVPAIVSDSEIIRGQLGAFNLPMFVVLATAVGALVVAIDAKNSADDAQSEADALAARVRALETASP